MSDKLNTGAWLLAQSKTLDDYAGADRLENITYAGKIGRLYNVLRRGAKGATSVIEAEEVSDLSRLNRIDKASREAGLKTLEDAGLISKGANGSVAIIGATSRSVLEFTSDTFTNSDPTPDELAVIDISDKISKAPLERSEASEYISDTYKITAKNSEHLIDLCRSTSIIDQEQHKDKIIVFNSNLFKDGERATKAFNIINALNATDQSLLKEAEELLRKSGTVYEAQLEKILGTDLFRRLMGIGYFDRMEVQNTTESVGYIALPDAFQRYGRPFEEDPIDDAKALLASLTYGMTRSGTSRGNIVMPHALLRALIDGRPVGPVTAIGQDYKELEKRGVVSVYKDRYAYSMKLLKRDVGELALTILSGGNAAQSAVLLGGSATSFKGPSTSWKEVRALHTVEDRPFVTDALNRLRSGA